MTRTIVVVGIDQSAPSRAALRWAADYARSTGATLHAISVHPQWHAALPYAVGVAGLPLIEQKSWDDQDRLAMADLFRSVNPEPGWELTQTTGDPGPELVRASDRAGLLVVGTREHRGFDRFLEGSVSHYCLRHSDIPVVAVPVPESSLSHACMDRRTSRPDRSEPAALDRAAGSGAGSGRVVDQDSGLRRLPH